MLPCFSRSLRLAQIDEGDIRPADQRDRLRGVSAQPRRAISCCARPIFMLDGTATSIIFGFGRFRLAISAT